MNDHHRQSSAQHHHQLFRIHLKFHRSLVIERHHLSLDIISHQILITSPPPLNHTIMFTILSSHHHPSTIKFLVLLYSIITMHPHCHCEHKGFYPKDFQGRREKRSDRQRQGIKVEGERQKGGEENYEYY